MSDSSDSPSPAPLPSHLTLHFSRGSHPRPFPYYLTPHGSYSLAAISLRAFVLGTVLSAALAATYALRASYPQLPLFVAALAAFHFLEFWITAARNPARAKVDAFILTNNGAAYQVAHTAALVEGALEWWLAPGMKAPGWGAAVGVAMVLAGQAVRTAAMAGAGQSFSHYVAYKREPGHVLVTDGVYRYIRHPSYFGYYVWALGTQLMLGNPVCGLAFAGFLWYFFKHRIDDEEAYLLQFFGERYAEYKQRSWSGIPFVSGPPTPSHKD
ncbi:Isoprenylcysteine carboxyl methyltransferase family-domain-containing protein [Geopyxis carbonaria]|nr:Isoprenylcysteine carboxyl methyltransferase family-domain-containing protein [Geopyxis carbonaria]